jgi:hypothetical protein
VRLSNHHVDRLIVRGTTYIGLFSRPRPAGLAHLVDYVIPRVPVRQWVLSFPIPLRILFAAHPDLLSPLLQIIHRVIATFLLEQAGLQRGQAHTGAVTLVQRFGSTANLNIHLHCLVLDGVYCSSEAVPVFHEVRGPTAAELETLLSRIIQRILKLLTRTGYLIEEQGMRYLAEAEPDSVLAPLQVAACTYRIALGPQAGQKVLSLQTVPGRSADSTQPGCVNAHGFSLHAGGAVPPINARSSNACAAISPARPLPTNGSNAIKQAKSCCSSRVPTATGPPIS